MTEHQAMSRCGGVQVYLYTGLKRLRGLQSRFGLSVNEEISAFAGNRTWFLNHPLTGLVTILTVSYLISSRYEGWNFNSDNYLFTTDTK